MLRSAFSASAVGLEIVVAISLPGYVGYRLDKKFGTQPWIMYIGICFGIGAAVMALVRLVRQYKRDSGDDADNKGSKGEGGPTGAN